MAHVLVTGLVRRWALLLTSGSYFCTTTFIAGTVATSCVLQFLALALHLGDGLQVAVDPFPCIVARQSKPPHPQLCLELVGAHPSSVLEIMPFSLIVGARFLWRVPERAVLLVDTKFCCHGVVVVDDINFFPEAVEVVKICSSVDVSKWYLIP